MQKQCSFRFACLRSLFSKPGEQHWPFIFRIQHRLLFVGALNPSSPFKFMNRNLRSLLIGSFVAYTCLLLAGTLFPFGFRLDARTVSYFPSPEWIPFTYHDPRCPWTGFFKDKLINIVMFLPFGVLLGIIIQSGATPERTLLKTTVSLRMSVARSAASSWISSEVPVCESSSLRRLELAAARSKYLLLPVLLNITLVFT